MASKAFHIILALKLLISTTGIGVFVHYCQNDGAIASLLVKATCSCQESKDTSDDLASCCSADSNECDADKDNCCSDEMEYVKNDIEHPRSVYITPSENTDQLQSLPVFINTTTDRTHEKLTTIYYTSKSPPNQVPLWLRYESILC